MADALASGASGSNTVWVQVPSPAFENEKTQAVPGSFSFSEAEASIEPMGSIFAPRPSAQSRGPLDLFLNPSHPISWMKYRLTD